MSLIDGNYLPYIHKPGFDNRRNPPGSSAHMDNLEWILELFTSREMNEISKYHLSESESSLNTNLDRITDGEW